jgi:hypothetical protein
VEPNFDSTIPASEISDKIAELGRTAREQLDQGRFHAARALDSAAVKLEGKAESAAADKAARALHHASGYLRDHDTEAMMLDLKQLVRHHPVEFLSAAVVTGYVIGRVLRGRPVI